ncbi:hypothetical protein AAEX63_03660 [Luteococcus sp. H138]|uniref:hypothetical protein n=1 Tax=unclassified Luteococcus TaxID=2639923 RepID=UPI00313A9B96
MTTQEERPESPTCEQLHGTDLSEAARKEAVQNLLADADGVPGDADDAAWGETREAMEAELAERFA